MSQKLPIDSFKWVEQLSKFNEKFIKNYNENSDKGYFLEVDIKYPKNYLILIKIYHFYQKKKKMEKVKKLVCGVKD